MISVGFSDNRIHKSYICRIKGISGNGQEVAVNGLLPEGYNLQSISNYAQPMLDFTAGQKLAAAGAITQELSGGITSQTIANSIQVYENETPLTLTLPLSFLALRNPVNEVGLPMRYLLEMKAPNLVGGLLEGDAPDFEAYWNLVSSYFTEKKTDTTGLSRRPHAVSVSIARHFLFPEALVTDVEIQNESVNHKSGTPSQSMINVTIAFQKAINNTEFANLFKFK